MAGPWGIVPTGFVVKSLDDILVSIESAEFLGISGNLNLNAPDPIAVLNGIFAKELASVWELAGALYSGLNPDGAAGDQLTSLALITGTTRLPATAATVQATVNINNGFNQAPGTMFAAQAGLPALLWTNVAAVVSPGGGPTDVIASFQAVSAGPTGNIAATTLTVIAAPISGWNSITNAGAGVAGTAGQSDASLRLARAQEIAGNGSTSAAAIQAAIIRDIQPANSPLSIPGIWVGSDVGNSPFTVAHGIQSCTVLWNDTNAVDANGLPPHSIEIIPRFYAGVFGTTDEDAICALVLQHKAAGIGVFSGAAGVYTQTIKDSQGISEAITIGVVAALAADVVLTVKVKAGFSVSSDNVKDAIWSFAAGTDHSGNILPNVTANWAPGTTAYISAIVGAVFSIPGVLNVTGVTLNGGGVDLSPTLRQVMVLGTITPTIV